MRGSPSWQVQEIFHQSGVNRIGESKHSAKEAAREGGATTWAQIGEVIGIHSYGTADAYRAVWKSVAHFARDEHGIRDIEKIHAEVVVDFLDSKIESGISHSTFMKYGAAISKMENALNMYAEKQGTGNTYDFRSSLSELRSDDKISALTRFAGTRAYSNPQALVAAVRDQEHHLASKVQFEAGARIHELSLIKADQLRGIRKDEHTGKQVGVFEAKGKGGKLIEYKVSPKTYAILQREIERNKIQQFKIDKNAYRAELKEAAAKTGQKYTGSHGLRWSHAQARFTELQQRGGQSYEQALGSVSHEMGHQRPDITEHYLR